MTFFSDREAAPGAVRAVWGMQACGKELFAADGARNVAPDWCGYLVVRHDVRDGAALLGHRDRQRGVGRVHVTQGGPAARAPKPHDRDG